MIYTSDRTLKYALHIFKRAAYFVNFVNISLIVHAEACFKHAVKHFKHKVARLNIRSHVQVAKFLNILISHDIVQYTTNNDICLLEFDISTKVDYTSRSL